MSTEKETWLNFLSMVPDNTITNSFEASLLTGGSVDWASDCHAGGRLRPDQHSGSLNNWVESAAFVITSANG